MAQSSLLLGARLTGAVWGHLIGDAAGVPYEGWAPAEIVRFELRGGGSHGQPSGTWSDDGALMLATLDSLLRDRAVGGERFDSTDQAHRFAAWWFDNAYTPDDEDAYGIGGTTRRALARIRRGVPAEEAGGTGEHDNGNGSLMRILPLALVERDVPDAELVDHAHRSSRITHGHTLSQASCALFSLIVRRLLTGTSPERALPDGLATLRALYADEPDRLAALDRLETWPKRSGCGFVVDSFWSAWDAMTGAGGYPDVIERAIRYGNDTDTTAAIAGGLAGAWLGAGAIPTEWLEAMRGRAVALPLVERLLRTAAAQTEA